MSENGRYFSPEYLEHSGIKGMKWGIRRFQNPDGSLTEAGRRRYLGKDGQFTQKGIAKYEKDIAKQEKKEAKEARKAGMGKDKTPYKKMTDAELKSRIERLRMEKDYKDLMGQLNTKKQKGPYADAIQKATTGAVTAAGKSLLTSGLIYTGKTLAKSLFGDKVYSEMFGGGKNESSSSSSKFSDVFDAVKDAFSSSASSANEKAKKAKEYVSEDDWVVINDTPKSSWASPSYTSDPDVVTIYDFSLPALPAYRP